MGLDPLERQEMSITHVQETDFFCNPENERQHDVRTY